MPATPPTKSVSHFFTQDSKAGRGVIVFVVLIVVGLTVTGWREALDGLSQVGLFNISLLCCFAAAHYVVRSLRWHLIVRGGKVATTLGQNMLHFFGGFAMTATPGRLGELVRLRWLCRDSGKAFGEVLPLSRHNQRSLTSSPRRPGVAVIANPPKKCSIF